MCTTEPDSSEIQKGRDGAMKGFAMLGIGKTGWIEKDAPACGPLDALVKPLAVSPCTSDVHTVWEGAIGDRHDMILGHEAVGEVVEVGALVKDFKPGDRVIVPAITPDWGALESQAGYSMHSGGMLAGWKFSNFKDGVFGELFHVNEADANLALLPPDIDMAAAVMLSDMVPTGFHGVELADVQFGDDVCVIGIGPVGLMAVAGAALRGAAHLYAVGSRPDCAALAREYGATDIINYREGDIVEQIMALTHGKGAESPVARVRIGAEDHRPALCRTLAHILMDYSEMRGNIVSAILLCRRESEDMVVLVDGSPHRTQRIVAVGERIGNGKLLQSARLCRLNDADIGDVVRDDRVKTKAKVLLVPDIVRL